MRTSRVFGRAIRSVHRGYGRIRDPRAVEITEVLPSGSVQSLQGRHTCSVATFKRDGTPVVTPVWFGLDGERLYFRAEPTSGKAKRLAQGGRVLIAPCTARGRPLAPPYAGTARVLAGADAAHAEKVIQAAFGLGRAIYERTLTQPDGVYIEVVPIAPARPGDAP